MLKSSRLNFIKINEASEHLFAEARFTYPVMKYITGHALTAEEARERYMKHTDRPVSGNYFVVEALTDKIIGLAKLMEEHPGVVEIGYSLYEEYWGKGLATEMAEALADYGIKMLKPVKIIGYVDSRNHASVRILEKLGLRIEKEMKERKEGIIYLFSKSIDY